MPIDKPDCPSPASRSKAWAEGAVAGSLLVALAIVWLLAHSAPVPAQAPELAWGRLPDLPQAVSGQFAGLSGGALIVAGGACFPTPLFEGGEKLWVDDIVVLRPGTEIWEPAGKLHRPLAYGASVTTNQGILCIGGGDAERHYADCFFLEWAGGQVDGEVERRPLPPLPQPCAFTSAALVGDTVYVAGGQDSPTATAALHAFWSLDLGQPDATWQSLPPWPGPARILPVAAATDEAFYLFSGCELYAGEDGKATRRYLQDAYRFEPGAGWKRLADLPRPAVAAPTPAMVVRDAHILVLGGDDGANADRVWELKDKHPGFPREVLAYDIARDEWRVAGSMPVSLVTTTAVPWADGMVIPGGEDRPGHRSPTVVTVKLTGEERDAGVFIEDGIPKLVREDGKAWTRAEGYVECGGLDNILWADRALGAGDFHVKARLTILNLDNSAASFVIDRTSHFGFEGANGRIFLEGPFFGRAEYLGDPGDFIEEGKPFQFEAVRRGGEVTFSIDGKPVHTLRQGRRIGEFGLRPWRSTMRIAEFSAEGDLLPPPPPSTQPRGYSIPTVDLSKETSRHVVVESTPGQYLGHPTTVLLADGKTMLCTYPLGHGGPSAVLKRSEDGGLTWSDRLPVPDNWQTATNCPCIHRLTDRDGVERLFVFEGNGDMRQSVSLDQGQTWTPFEPNGLHCVVAPITIVPIAGERHLALYHRGQNDRGEASVTIWQSISQDGGLTWGPERMVAEREWADLCEPALFRSPDGKQLAALIRENTRRYNSFLITSDDEGETWSPPVELPGSLTGDRHLPRYAPDGRVVIPFRDVALDSPTRGDFVAWVGTYDDLVNLREGQYRVWLLDSPVKSDLGYPGLEVLPDGTLAATTYAVLRPGERHSVVSVRFTLDEVDTRHAMRPVQQDIYVSGTEGYHTFRIPSVIVTQKGTVLALCEGRKDSPSDSGDIDLVLKRSLDGGETWGPLQIVAEDGPNTMGNPCPVVDRDTGTIWMLMTHNLGEDRESEIVAQTSKGTRTVWVTKSTDDGVTWAEPVEITATTKQPDWTWYATGPGVGIQLRSGRMVIPCDHIVAETDEFRSHTIYSDDHGETWQLGGAVGPGLNECQVVELADGSLLLNMRNYDRTNSSRRAIARSTDEGETWTELAYDDALVEPVCQASFLRYTSQGPHDRNRLLFSNPAARKREKMAVRLSYDEGRTWPAGSTLHLGPSAYSCLTVLPDMTIGCLYERGDAHPYERITFARFSLPTLTGGRDELAAK